MSKTSAKVICHSKAPNGEELITLEVEFHRFILAEVNTHRVLSRNYQSSRACPVEKMIEQVRTNPAMPVHWGKNQSGMVAEKEGNALVSDSKYSSQDWWKLSALSAARFAEELHEAGYHKQIVNRIIEPFIWTKGVITATKEGWDSVFKLRLHKDAQPEFQALAYEMKGAIDSSIPNELNYGEYHLPYVNLKSVLTDDFEVGSHFKGNETVSQCVEDAVKVSTSCTAQVSYRRLDDSLGKALRVYGMLNLPVEGIYPEDPPHYSPTEHVAKVVEDWEHESFMGGNFTTNAFWQYRKALELGNEKQFLGVYL